MTSQTPPKKQTALPHDSPPPGNNFHSDPSYQSAILEKASMAVILDLGSYVPMISFEDFMKYLAPPQPDFDVDATTRSLPVLAPPNRRSKFLKASKDSQGSKDSTVPEIFTKVVAAVVANSHGKLTEEDRTIDFLQNPSRAPTSTERHDDSRPDGYFVLKHRDKVMSKDGKREDICWDDIALSYEYKRNDGDDDLDDLET
jgi:hypothetical protein